VFGNHAYFGDGKAVLSSACLVPDEIYVMAHMRPEVSAAGSDLESLASVVFRDGVGTVRARQATLDVHLVWVAACRGSLCKP
jgi:hypothetical protein